jgi:uncharacterized repeat protein (TIGR03809 family)
MPGQIPRCMPAEITHKGRELAEKRRAHLVELYDTGRWKHYYTQEQLLAHMREAIRLVETWERFATPPAERPRAIAAE